MNHYMCRYVTSVNSCTRFETALLKALNFMSPLMMASVNDLGIVC